MSQVHGDAPSLGHELVGHGLPVLVGDEVGGEGGLQVQPQRQLRHLRLHQGAAPKTKRLPSRFCEFMSC